MTNKKENNLVFWVFVGPVVLAFLLVVVVPFCLGFWYSFTDWTSSARAGAGTRFIGLTNYAKSLTDPAFAYSFLTTFAYTLVNMAAVNVVAFALAMLVTSKVKGRHVYRVGFFLPNLIGGLILGYVWQFVFNDLVPAVLPGTLLLADSNTAVLALVIVGTWQYAGYIMMIYVAAIENVPQELHEAAQIDGASPSLRLWKITVPLAAQAITVTMFLTLVQSFKQFDVNVSLTAGGPATMFAGKPILGTELLALNIYNTAFISDNLAEGQARAVIFFLVLALVAVIQVAFNKKKELEL